MHKRGEFPDGLIPAIAKFLGPDGIEFFQDIMEQHGKLAVVRMIPYGDPDAFPVRSFPHTIHSNEGMQIRNFIREWHQDNHLEIPDCHLLDDSWEQLTIKAIQ